MKKLTLNLALAAALTTAFAAGTAQAVIIDDFNGGAQTLTANGSSLAFSPGAIGGVRLIDIEKDGPLGVGATAAVLVGPDLDIFSHSADALTSATSVITWNGFGADMMAPGLGGVDLVEGLTDNVFSFDIVTIDQGNIGLTLGVQDTFGGTDSYTFLNAGVGTESVAFSLFAGVDFTSINSISLTVEGGMASDLTLDQLATSGSPASVPEPTALMLLSGGLLGLSGIRRKRKKNS